MPEVLNRGSRFAAVVVLARALSLHAYSVLNVGIAAAGLAMTFTTLGLPEVGARDSAIHPEQAGWLAGRIVLARLSVLLIVVGVSLGVALAIHPPVVPAVAASAAMALCAASSAEWLLRGLERMRQLGLANAAGGATVLAGSFVVLAVPSAVFALAIFACGEAMVSFLCWRAARPISVRPGYSRVEGLLRRSWPIALSTIAFQAYYANIDTLLIAGTRSTDEAGLYSAAYRVFLTLNVVSLFAANALLPLLARARHGSRDDLADDILSESLRPLLSYGVVILGATELVARPLLSVLFGSRFGRMDHVLVVLCIGLMWYAVGFPSGYAFVASNRNRRYLAGAATAAVLNLVLNVALIPVIGAIGAALATAAALGISCLVWMHLQGLLRGDAARVAGLLCVATAGAAVALSLPALRLPVGVVTAGFGASLAIQSIRRLVPEPLAAMARRRGPRAQ